MHVTHNSAVRSLQIVNHIAGLLGIWYAISTQQYWYFLVVWAVYWFIGIVGINVAYHRLLSHRSFTTYPIIEKIVSIIGVLTTVGSPLAWCAVHRQHHKAAETKDDVHSPYYLGKFRAWFGFWNLKGIRVSHVKDLRKDPFQKFLHNRYFWVIAAYVAVLVAIDPWLAVFAYAIPASLCLHSSSAIIVIAHIHGYQTYDLKHDQARNSWICNIITMGEGWHNNHHAKPRAWSNWEKWWEWDIPSLVIRLIRKHETT